MKNKLLGTAIIAASTAVVTTGCGILETLETVEIPRLRFDSNSYIVQPGDTLDSVASRYKIDPDSLLTVNSLQLAELIPGQRLVLLRDKDGDSSKDRITGIATNGTGTAIGGAEAAGVGQPVLLPNATQSSSSARVSESNRILTDNVLPGPDKEEIIGVVDAAQGDALLDDQPVFVKDTGLFVKDSEMVAKPVPVPVERPQGVETIVQSVDAGVPVTPVPASIPTAATIEIVDANSSGSNKRITVNQRADGWNWPVLGTITQDFDLREINRQGLDIDAGADAAIQAAADGEVVYSGRDLASYGNLVILRHENNYLSAYSKVSDIFVTENQKVKGGDVIASVGKNEAGIHEMHFEIRQNGEPVNPVDYLPAL